MYMRVVLINILVPQLGPPKQKFLAPPLVPYTVHGIHKLLFSSNLLLKMGPTLLFTHFKIILLQYF